MNPIQKALAQADKIIAANAALEAASRPAVVKVLRQYEQTVTITARSGLDVTAVCSCGWDAETTSYPHGTRAAQNHLENAHGIIRRTDDNGVVWERDRFGRWSVQS